MSLSEDAAAFARVAHSGQFDKVGEPYIGHVTRVADALRAAGFGDDVVATGYLHDVVEDCDITLEDLTGIFPPQVIEAVDALSKRKGERFEHYYERVKAVPIAIAVKWFDVEDNSREDRLSRMAPDTRDRLRAKYERARATLTIDRGVLLDRSQQNEDIDLRQQLTEAYDKAQDKWHADNTHDSWSQKEWVVHEMLAALAALARYVELCAGDKEAINVMRKLTGLTVTDPEADRPVMEKRLAEFRHSSESES